MRKTRSRARVSLSWRSSRSSRPAGFPSPATESRSPATRSAAIPAGRSELDLEGLGETSPVEREPRVRASQLIEGAERAEPVEPAAGLRDPREQRRRSLLGREPGKRRRQLTCEGEGRRIPEEQRRQQIPGRPPDLQQGLARSGPEDGIDQQRDRAGDEPGGERGEGVRGPEQLLPDLPVLRLEHPQRHPQQVRPGRVADRPGEGAAVLDTTAPRGEDEHSPEAAAASRISRQSDQCRRADLRRAIVEECHQLFDGSSRLHPEFGCRGPDLRRRMAEQERKHRLDVGAVQRGEHAQRGQHHRGVRVVQHDRRDELGPFAP